LSNDVGDEDGDALPVTVPVPGDGESTTDGEVFGEGEFAGEGDVSGVVVGESLGPGVGAGLGFGGGPEIGCTLTSVGLLFAVEFRVLSLWLTWT
jgi:hypothetical protein